MPSGSEGAASGKAGAAGSSKAASKLLKGGGKKLSKWANKALHAIQDQVSSCWVPQSCATLRLLGLQILEL